MVLIAATICTKSGSALLSRQFVEMPKVRIEGLLAAFPKLMTAGKQHTFVETDSVRYVYQPLDKLYMLLITTKASNILEDLETLRLFSRVIPEYCVSLTEADVLEQEFNLIFAFDEIVALGYRESINLAQIRTFVEMDSHEEKVYQAVRQTQEREAKNKMREKARELQRERMENVRKGGTSISITHMGSGNISSGISSNNSNFMDVAPSNVAEIKPSNTFSSASREQKSRNAMKLGSKSRDVDTFVDQLKNEGEVVSASSPGAGSIRGDAVKTTSATRPKMENMEEVHLKLEDKLSVRIGRDGGIQNFELSGLLTLHISDEQYGRLKVHINNQDTRGIQLQTHPNVDKELFRSTGCVGLKNPTKPFPLNTDVGVLKWRFQTTADAAIPLNVNCWPSENGQGGCDVNIEYELDHSNLVLQDVVILIPLPIGCVPIVNECDGAYAHQKGRNMLQWTIPIIDASQKSGTLEFTASSSTPNDFFPLQVTFTSETPYTDINPDTIVALSEGGTPGDNVKFSISKSFHPEKYEVV
ncbi:coatomer subunit delta [Arctopsyche grandis]|uniref:coatomer subunit delta n=1 Tax=Arctopsyche grandis TaxID=121162 RepID=UPI00406D662F